MSCYAQLQSPTHQSSQIGRVHRQYVLKQNACKHLEDCNSFSVVILSSLKSKFAVNFFEVNLVLLDECLTQQHAVVVSVVNDLSDI